MGLFNKNNKKEEEIVNVLTEIKDNLKYGVNEDRFDTVISNLENKIIDYKHSNDEEIGVLTRTVNSIADKTEKLEQLISLHEKSITNLENIVKKQSDQINTLIDVNKGLCDIIKIDVKKNIKKSEPNKKLIRHYPPTTVTAMPKIRELTPEGKLILKSGKIAGYNINTILKLKKLIPTDLSFIKIGAKVGLSNSTVSRVCCAIEYGVFDKYLNEWEQIQANKFYKKNKNNLIENNPQKRKEKGYC